MRTAHRGKSSWPRWCESPFSHLAVLLVVLGVTGAVCGCGFSQGQLLYFMADWQGPKVEAEFQLTREGPVLILVDDLQERLSSPRSGTTLAKQLAKELETNRAVDRLVPQAKLGALRRQHQDFDQISCREIGEQAGAHQVLYLEVRDFYAEPEVEDAGGAARISVAVKVINVLEKKDRDKVRLWPAERDGRVVSADLDAAAVMQAKTPNAISDRLTRELAAKLARLFYDHRVADAESS